MGTARYGDVEHAMVVVRQAALDMVAAKAELGGSSPLYHMDDRRMYLSVSSLHCGLPCCCEL